MEDLQKTMIRTAKKKRLSKGNQRIAHIKQIYTIRKHGSWPEYTKQSQQGQILPKRGQTKVNSCQEEGSRNNKNGLAKVGVTPCQIN